MHQSILEFAKQLSFKPEIKNGSADGRGKSIVVAGMGGSHLSAGLLKLHDPFIEISTHRNYGLPAIAQETLTQSLLVASSYSGNTEETLDFLEHALKTGLRPVVIASGGELLKRAEEERLPFIQIPNTVIQPRVAVGLSLVALATFAGRSDLLVELTELSSTLKPETLEGEGKRIAQELAGFVPLIYVSAANESIAYNWKIKINETAKTPAFCNVFPELNHNEFAGFSENEKGPRSPWKVLIIRDNADHPRISKRMDVTKQILGERGIQSVETVLEGESRIQRAFRSLVIADWASYHLALSYGVNPDDNPAVEQFKKQIS